MTIPEGVDDVAVRKRLLNEWNIEIGGGLGDLKGKAWRIGLMGYGSRRENVTLVLAALETCLRDSGASIEPGAGLAAAAEVYAGRRLPHCLTDPVGPDPRRPTSARAVATIPASSSIVTSRSASRSASSVDGAGGPGDRQASRPRSRRRGRR